MAQQEEALVVVEACAGGSFRPVRDPCVSHAQNVGDMQKKEGKKTAAAELMDQTDGWRPHCRWRIRSHPHPPQQSVCVCVYVCITMRCRFPNVAPFKYKSDVQIL